jgi:hypothetical protein
MAWKRSRVRIPPGPPNPFKHLPTPPSPRRSRGVHLEAKTLGTRGHRAIAPCPHAISLRQKDLSLVGTLGTMFSCVSLVEKKRIFSIQENHPAHGAQTRNGGLVAVMRKTDNVREE